MSVNNKKLNSDFRLLFNKFKNQKKFCLSRIDDLLNFILNPSNTNIKYMKNFLLKKSNENDNLNNFDTIVKKIYKMSHNSMIIQKVQQIAFKMIYGFVNNNSLTTSNENNLEKIKNLINHLVSLTYESYHNIMSNSTNININYLYNHEQLETIIGYLILLNYNNEMNDINFMNDTIQNCGIFKWELLDASIGFIYQLKKYIKIQLKYFNILKGLYTSYSDYYFKLLRYNYDINQTIKNINYWFKNLNLDITPSSTDIDNWRIYYIVNSVVYNKNISIRRNILTYPDRINNNFNIVEIYLDYVLNFPSIPINNLWESTQTIINEYEYMTVRNLKLLIAINKYILKNYKNTTNNNIALEWKTTYHTLACNIIYLMDKSIKDIKTYILKINLYFNDYTIYVINLEYINTILIEIENIVNIYSCLNFNNDQLSDIIVRIFKMYNNYNFERLFDNVYYFDANWKHIIYTVKKKSKTDNQFLEYLCDKLIQNEFDYNKLELFARITLPNKWIDIMDSFSNEDDLPEEFYDPFTNEIIHEPLILPITGQITDKNVIYKILINNPINPFNRLELSIKELDEYNMQPEIVEKLVQFKNDLKDKRHKTQDK